MVATMEPRRRLLEEKTRNGALRTLRRQLPRLGLEESSMLRTIGLYTVAQDGTS